MRPLAEIAADLQRIAAELAEQAPGTVRLSPGEDILVAVQALLETGGTVELEPGDYAGPLVLPERPTDAPLITIRSTGDLPDGRVGPSDKPEMAHITATSEGALRAENTSGFEFDGISFGRTPTGSGEIVVLENSERIVLDRVLIDAHEGQKRLIRANCRNFALTESWLDGGPWQGQDSQAICAWNGASGHTIVDNYLAASGENILYGGADSSSEANNPQDIFIEGNLIHKPQTWRQFPGAVKNLIELKNATDVTISRNQLNGVWADAQSGYAIMLTPVNQDASAPWSVVKNVLIEYNTVINADQGVNTTGHGYEYWPGAGGPTGQTSGIVIRKNLFEVLGRFLLAGGEIADLTLDGNVIDNGSNFGGLYLATVADAEGNRYTSRAVEDLTVVGNVFRDSDYGLHSDSGIGTLALNGHTGTWTWSQNQIQGLQYNYPEGTVGISEEDFDAAVVELLEEING